MRTIFAAAILAIAVLATPASAADRRHGPPPPPDENATLPNAPRCSANTAAEPVHYIAVGYFALIPEVTLIEQETIACTNGVARARAISIEPYSWGSHVEARYFDVDCAHSTMRWRQGVRFSGNDKTEMPEDPAMTPVPDGSYLAQLAGWVCGGPPSPDAGPSYTDIDLALKEIEARFDQRN